MHGKCKEKLVSQYSTLWPTLQQSKSLLVECIELRPKVPALCVLSFFFYCCNIFRSSFPQFFPSRSSCLFDVICVDRLTKSEDRHYPCHPQCLPRQFKVICTPPYVHHFLVRGNILVNLSVVLSLRSSWVTL